MQIQGSIKNVTYQNPANGFTVLKVVLSDTGKVAVVTGNFPALTPGENLRFEGEWGRHPKFGEQFKATGFEILKTGDGNLRDYLASGLFRGIGPKTAERLVEAFGDTLPEVLDNHPERLSEVKIKGITPKKMAEFLASWQEARLSRETMLFLYSHGIVGSTAKRLWSTYGEDTIPKIKENPYLLCEEVWGIGFASADEIAMKLGLPKDSPMRFQAALLYSLQESSFNEGHVYLPKDALLDRTLKNLRIDSFDDDAVQILMEQFEGLCKSGRITRVGDDCFYPSMFRAEDSVARNIALRLQRNTLPTEGFEQYLVSWEREHEFSFDPVQRQAIEMALSHKFSIVTGGPGTGKTTILKGILHLANQMGESVLLAAPTGRAAKRMESLCGAPAKTIHRLLEMDPVSKKFNRNIGNQLHCDLLIVDEFSMVDTWLASSLLEAVSLRARILLVGDADQLPSVGPGNVLNDLLQCPKIPSVRLQHIFRQASGNDIADKAAKINQGIMPSPIDGPNFHFMPYETPEEALGILQKLVTTGVRSKLDIDLKSDLQILAPMRKGPLGVFELNQFLQKLMNGSAQKFKIGGTEWGAGDRVMQTTNNYDKNVFNGDVGIIFSVKKDKSAMTVFFDDKTVDYEGDEIEDLQLAYAFTIHKSQGSEYPAVIVILDSSHYVMLQRNLLYTAITRAKGHVWVLSAPGAFHQAVRNNRSTRRFTRLKERLG